MRRITSGVLAALTGTLTVVGTAAPAAALPLLQTYVVVTTNDAGAGSLRDAITMANGNAGADTIEFNIQGGGVQVITLAADLPAITDPVKIRGYTQPGAAQATLAAPAALRIVLDATNVGFGLDLRADESVIAGLVIRSAAGPAAAGAACVNDGLCVTGDRNVIRGNYIGVGYAGMNPLGNSGDGIQIVGDGNTVGGPGPGDRNVISANQRNGIDITGAGNVVQGNLVGTDAASTGPLGNDRGVKISGVGNTVGGITVGAGNVISGNTLDGVLIDGEDNVVEGNLIGTDGSGGALLANDNGVNVRSGARNRVGDTAVAARNVIACNNICVYVDQATDTTVRGNFVGTDTTGLVSFAAGGGNTGIEVGRIAGTVITGNVVARMHNYGMDIDGDGTIVEGNKIGTNALGTAPLGNDTGILITADGSHVGGPTDAQANLISGNLSDGVRVDNVGSGNVIEGNVIGADVTGLLPLGNGGDGVHVGSGSGNLVGGSGDDTGNVISANGGDGVLLDSNGQRVEGNLIGIGSDGTVPLGNLGNGVRVHGDDHVIGGIAKEARNVISANGGVGVLLEPDADDIQVLGNAIGTDAALNGNRGNGSSGIVADGTGNAIGSTDPNAAPNVIAHNNGDGITVKVPAGGSSTAMAHNVIYANTRLGIDLNPNGVTANDAMDADAGANGLQNYPVLNSATTVAGATTVNWSLNSLPGSQFRIEFFANGACDGAGHGEGRAFLGEIVVNTTMAGNAGGNTPTAVAAGVGQQVTATATLLNAAATNDATSEFSACVPVV